MIATKNICIKMQAANFVGKIMPLPMTSVIRMKAPNEADKIITQQLLYEN